MKCRTRRALDFRTHIAASGLSRGFVCLRVGMILKSLYKSCLEYTPIYVAILVGLMRHQTERANTCVLSFHSDSDNGRTPHVLPAVCLVAMFHKHVHVFICVLQALNMSTVADQLCVYTRTLLLSTSDQARLPAEFKHITKRWKRNQTGYP